MIHDPRKAATLEEAARNPDGTYNGARALAWLSEALSPGQGLSEQEVRKLWDEAQATLQALQGDA
ncbi:hypothetical protein JCM15519_06920 [Fundidesulfovibrio butyratiphilus]